MRSIVGRIAATVREDSRRAGGHRGGIITSVKNTKTNSVIVKSTRLSDTVFVRPFANWIVIIERSSSWKND